MKAILMNVLKTIGKFLKWGFASQLTIGVFGVIEYLAGHSFWSLVIIIWGILLTINEYKQKS
jgi:hypothetical protein